MRIKETELYGVVILTLTGKMMNGPESIDLHPHVKRLIGEGKINLVVDMGKVKWFSSTGLGALLASYTSIRNAGGEMKIARATKRIYSLFYQMELASLFDTYDTVDEAVEAFKKESAEK